jgi:hypothetical protein
MHIDIAGQMKSEGRRDLHTNHDIANAKTGTEA